MLPGFSNSEFSPADINKGISGSYRTSAPGRFVPLGQSTTSNFKALMEQVHLSVRVYGRVQGVFFRYFAQDIARRLGLKGYVRNLSNGDAVEVEAEGDRQQLENLVEQLKIGPPAARVKKVEINWSDYSGQFNDFRITY